MLFLGPKQMAKVDQGFFSLWIWKHLNSLPLSYIGFGGHGHQVRDILHVDDLNEFVHAQILKIKTIFNVTLSAGGGKKLISLRELTNLCQKITGNKTKILPMSKTSIFDIPYFCTSNKVSKNYITGRQKEI